MGGSNKAKNWSKFKIIGLRILAVIGFILLLPFAIILMGPFFLTGLTYEKIISKYFILVEYIFIAIIRGNKKTITKVLIFILIILLSIILEPIFVVIILIGLIPALIIMIVYYFHERKKN